MRRRQEPGAEPGEFSARRWPDWSFWWENGYGSAGRGRRASTVANAVAALALVPQAVESASGGHGPALTVLLVAVAVCYAVAVPLAVWFGPTRSRGGRVAVVAVLFVLGVAPAVLLRAPELLTDCTFAVAIGLMLLPLRWSLPLGLGTVAVQAGWMLLARGAVDPVPVATLAGVTLVLGMVFALTFAIGHLQAAREQVRFLAVARERERVARDLHDVLGHSLSTLTVKAGLARRMLETGGNLDRATTEVREIEGLSRQALSDVRATVSGYRTVDLAAEIAGARLALGAAGVRADLPATVDDVDPGLREVFGYVVREAVTNVIRHSGATHCAIRLGRSHVSVTDDGGPATGAPPGNGLTGLAERLDAVSGSLDHGERPGGGFRVVARGPAPAGVPAAVAEQGGPDVIRVLLADDQALVRGALASLLGLEQDMTVVAEVGSGDEVLPAARRTGPDVALLDVQMPGPDGLAVAADLHRELPACRVVICTTFARPGYLTRALAAGAAGFVVKDSPPEALVDAVRRVHAGLRVVDPALAAESLTAGSGPLTDRERDVLRAAADGGTVADIARAVYLSPGTVRNHLSAAMGKTGARTRAEAVRLAEAGGWL